MNARRGTVPRTDEPTEETPAQEHRAQETVAPVPALLVSPDDAARLLAIGRTALYALLGSGDLPSVQIGRRRRVRVSDLEAFVEHLPTGEVGEERHSRGVGSGQRSTLWELG